VSAGSLELFSYYNLKIYQLFAELLKKQENSLIKLIFFMEKWMEREPSKKEKLKLELELFRTYYDMGIYERALQLFDQISSENVVYLGPDYLFMLANIKHFDGEEKEAISILQKVIEIAQDEEARVMYSYRILELDLEEESHQLRFERERALEKMLKNYGGKNSDEVLSLYADYLSRRGDYDRASLYSNRMRKTANFCEFFNVEDKQERKHFAKK
jgi:tetratricopeptide (TPR) repeat protein